MNTTPKLTNRVLADVYKTSERQIARWKAEDAPLLDIGQMVLFWLCRKSYPQHLQHLSEEQKAEMQRRLDVYSGGRTDEPTWLDYIRSFSEAMCECDRDLAVLREHPNAPPAVRSNAEKLTKLFHKFDDAFHDSIAAAGVDVDAEIIGIDSYWKRQR